ncbi:Fungalysin metallopeptidase-domain-containing protein [Absidia repens]|uniref:Extracellular metalloproteinase n=1 Tax=Absidia repens TaxID=90262 RepID=A0A1X2IZ30_9FUNG|nr:Fungalysin metallopeptidase-domain-containing protein [Absidia repens]
MCLLNNHMRFMSSYSMRFHSCLVLGLLLGVNQLMVASIPLKQHHHRDLVPNFGPDDIHREYLADTPIKYYLPSLSGVIIPENISLAFVRSALTNSDFIIHASYKSDLSGVTHFHLRQTVNGLQVLNGNININVLPNGQVLSYGNSFAKANIKARKRHSSFSLVKKLQYGLAQVILGQGNRLGIRKNGRFTYMETEVTEGYGFVKGNKMISPSEAVVALFDFVKPKLSDTSIGSMLTPQDLTVLSSHGSDHGSFISIDGVPCTVHPVRARHAYVQQNNNHLVRVWDIEMELEDHWYSGQVHAFDGTMVGLVDWVHDFGPATAYYNVIPFGSNDPLDSQQCMVKNPYDAFASPEGWHSQGAYSKRGTEDNQKMSSQEGLTFNVTVGNNVYAHTNPDGGYQWENNYRPQGHTGGGFGGDALVFDYNAKFDVDEPEAYQDAAVTNLFYWCNMAHDLFYRYGFDEKAGNFQQDNLGRGRKMKADDDDDGENDAVPMRDGDFESGIVIHEYTHGLSNRLTGGPKNSNCLGWGEAGGMGEGWGDFVATILRMKPKYKRDIDFGMGDWANGGESIRKYKRMTLQNEKLYSTSMYTNPSTYKMMDQSEYWSVHAKGEVWAEMLYEVYWNLVDKHGFTSDWFPPTPATASNRRGIPIMSTRDLRVAKHHIFSYGNTLALQLVMDGMKLQPCSPSFVNARDAILDADRALTGGENYCTLYTAFAKRGLGVKAKLDNEGWTDRRIEDYNVPPQCQ